MKLIPPRTNLEIQAGGGHATSEFFGGAGGTGGREHALRGSRGEGALALCGRHHHGLKLVGFPPSHTINDQLEANHPPKML